MSRQSVQVGDVYCPYVGWKAEEIRHSIFDDLPDFFRTYVQLSALCTETTGLMEHVQNPIQRANAVRTQDGILQIKGGPKENLLQMGGH